MPKKPGVTVPKVRMPTSLADAMIVAAEVDGIDPESNDYLILLALIDAKKRRDLDRQRLLTSTFKEVKSALRAHDEGSSGSAEAEK